MRWSWQVARVNGVPIELHWLFGLLLAWAAFAGWSQAQWLGMAYTTGLLMATFGCILLHEIGHTVEAQAIGLPVRRIVLLPMGGLAQLAYMPERPVDELRIAVAGPVVNAALAMVSGSMLILWLQGSGTPLPSWQRLGYEIARGQPGGLHFWATLTFVNLGLLSLNLLPAFPLDGGRILRGGLSLLLPPVLATRIVVRAGWLLGALCLLLASGASRIWGEAMAVTLIITGLMAIVGAGAEELFQRSQGALRGVPVQHALRQPTWILQPAEVLTPGLLRAIDSLNPPALPVVDNSRLIGLVTRRALASKRVRTGALKVADIMHSNFVQAEVCSDLWRAQQLMLGASQEFCP